VTKTGQTVVASIAIFIVVSVLVHQLVDNIDRDSTPVQFSGTWQPGNNEVRFQVRVGERRQVFRPTGPEYVYEDTANPGQTVELTIESRSEQPVVLSDCSIQFHDQLVQGGITREGAECHAAAVIPR
jgi:hypothetical protein